MFLYKKLGFVLMLTLGLTALVLFAVAGAPQAPTVASGDGWLTVYSDTFTTLLPGWTIFDNTANQYQWGVTAYTRSHGSLIVADSGLWAVGGGGLGGAHSWPTGTYPSRMYTWAIAGPFTLTDTVKIWDIRLTLSAYNRTAADDVFFMGLSSDGVDFKGLAVTESFTAFRGLEWTSKDYNQAERIWIGLRFQSTGSDTEAGPLIDDLTLAFNYGTATYLPLVRRDPPPTPTPTLPPTATPTPVPVYLDHFDDSTSGWSTETALRFNKWPPPNFEHQRWEEVAYLSYQLGYYRWYVPVTWHGGEGNVDTWFVWPAQAAPMPESHYPLPARYCVEARAKLANSWADYQPWWAHWGIVFGANEEMTELYTFQMNANHSFGAQHYHNYLYPGNRQPLTGEEVNVENTLLPWTTDDYGTLIPTAAYNTVKVVVRDTLIDFYLNNVKVGFVNLYDMPRENVGLIGGSFESTPVEYHFDYFAYDATCTEAQEP